MTFRKFVRLWLPVVIWMGVIFLGSSIGNVPKTGGVAVDAIVHRTAHVIEFAILGWLLLRAISAGCPISRREMMIALIVIAVYGASDEFHQRFTPGRSSELSAVLFDTAGGLIGMWLWRWKSRKSTSERIGDS